MEPAPGGRRRWIPVLLWMATAVAAGAGFHWLMPPRGAGAPDRPDELGELGKGPLAQCLAELKENPDNQALRERIVRLAAQAKPPPEIPAQARDRHAHARRLFAAARTVDDVGQAVEEYQAALLVAPWWPEANRDLGLALELAQQHEEAVAALRLCLAAGPPAAEARAIQDDIRRIEAALRRSAEPEAEAAVACEVLVPALVADYWLYIDGRLVSSPPHEGHGIALTTVELGSGQGCEFWDAKGLAIKVNGKGQLISVRSDIRDRAYSKQVLHLEPGTHRFDLLLLNAADFPLSVGSQEVELQAEESAEVKLGMPPGHAYGPRLQAIAAMAYGGSWQQRFDQTQTFLKVRIGGLAADPVARALAESLAGLKISRPERPVVWVNLPETRGGRRELDARLVSALLRHLRSEYEVGEAWAAAPAEAPADYRDSLARLLPLIRAHNRRIKDLEEIGAILARVKTGGPGAE